MTKTTTNSRPDAAALVAEWENIRATTKLEDGWDLFGVSDDRPTTLTIAASSGRFPDDAAAYAHVKKRADSGFEVERIALAVHHLDAEEDTVIDCALGGFTRRELARAFDLVADPKNWKNEIRAEGLRLTERDVRAVESACVFFAGSPVDVFVEDDGTHSISGAGYYACIGS